MINWFILKIIYHNQIKRRNSKNFYSDKKQLACESNHECKISFHVSEKVVDFLQSYDFLNCIFLFHASRQTDDIHLKWVYIMSKEALL